MSGAGGLVLLEMRPELRARLGLPELRFPVRRERLAAVMSGGRMRLDLLLDELDRFLAGRPELRERYAAAGAALALTAGVELGRGGFHPGAAHCFEIGLALAPENDSLRTNYALALMAIGRKPQALRQLELVMSANRDEGPDPAVWTLAGRLCLETGNAARAARLLGAVATFGPSEDAFWELLARAREQANLEPGDGGLGLKRNAPIPMARPVTVPVARLVMTEPPIAPAVPVAPAGPCPGLPACPACRAELPSEARFCPQCGAALGH